MSDPEYTMLRQIGYIKIEWGYPITHTNAMVVSMGFQWAISEAREYDATQCKGYFVTHPSSWFLSSVAL